MKVYVSSTFEDLKEYRAAAIRGLRQSGHEVVAMEDYPADSAIPLKKVLEDVASSEAYVGIFAWRYGYIPGANDRKKGASAKPPDRGLPTVGEYGKTSITEWEYLQAKRARPERPLLAFLLDEGVSWPPHLIDGFTPGTDKANIIDLRTELQEGRLVSYFKSPTDLEARVIAAITSVNMSAQVALRLLVPATETTNRLQTVSEGVSVRESGSDFAGAVIDSQAERIIRIDIDSGKKWWSTRLYLLAYLIDSVTDVQRILILGGKRDDDRMSPVRDDFVGLLSMSAIKSQLAAIHPELAAFDRQMGRRRRVRVDVQQEANDILSQWEALIPVEKEREVKKPVTRANLAWWFGDAMLSQPLRIADLGTATPFDLARLLDYPSDYVPVTTSSRPDPRGAPSHGASDAAENGTDPPQDAPLSETRVRIVDKTALNAELARSYLDDLLTRARITSSA